MCTEVVFNTTYCLRSSLCHVLPIHIQPDDQNYQFLIEYYGEDLTDSGFIHG